MSWEKNPLIAQQARSLIISDPEIPESIKQRYRETEPKGIIRDDKEG